MERGAVGNNTQNSMTKTQAVDAMLHGLTVLVCEYRGGRADKIDYRDKLTRQPMSFVGIRHSIEVNGNAAFVTERVADDFEPNNFSPRFEKGTMVVLTVESMSTARGITTYAGTLELLTD